MAKEIKSKTLYGGYNIDQISPTPPDGTLKGLNVVISFEYALKLYTSFGQILGHLKGYKRTTNEEKRSAVNLCIYSHAKRITVNEDRLKVP